mmetsp:Transcript_8910/g.24828  ORF Transcript_8910/g.24828 Transcript_8910/m.24828 type:complete len:186 (-) Transcript_8910:276-833(-)
MHLGKFPHGNLGKSASETSLGGISIASDTTGKPAMAPPRSTTGMLLSEQPHYPGKPDALGRLPLPPPSQVQGMYSYQGQQLRSPLSSIHALGPKGRGGYAYVNTDSQAFHTPAPNWVVEEVIDFGLPDDWGVREMHEPEFGVGCDMSHGSQPQRQSGIFSHCATPLCDNRRPPQIEYSPQRSARR